MTDIAEAVAWIGAGSEAKPRSQVPTWRRLYEHALGALHAVQEQADDARPSLERALGELPEAATHERATVEELFAELAVRQGRTDEALAWLDRAAKDQPHHPALAHTRGEAFTSVWRWRESLAPLVEAAKASPRDDRAWVHLAVAYGSAGESALALTAARRGLALRPRDQDLLRVQWLALDGLGAPESEVERARAAFVLYRSPDDAPKVRSLCSKNVPGCALERIPVHVHELRRAALQ